MKIPLGTATFILNGLSKGSEKEKLVAFELLHDHYWKPLCRRLTAVERCDPQSAEDIVQETFIRVFKASQGSEMPEPEALHSWILIISKRIFLDKWRNKATEQSLELKEAKEKINSQHKLAKENYTKATNSKDEQKITEAFKYLSNIERKVNTINGDYGTLAFDEAINEFSDDSQNEVGTTGLSFSANLSYEDSDQKSLNSELTEEPMANGTRREKLHNCIMEALQKLRKVSAARAEALNLDFEGLSSKEIALIINRTEQATRQFLSESRKAFRNYSEHCKIFYETA